MRSLLTLKRYNITSCCKVDVIGPLHEDLVHGRSCHLVSVHLSEWPLPLLQGSGVLTWSVCQRSRCWPGWEKTCRKLLCPRWTPLNPMMLNQRRAGRTSLRIFTDTSQLQQKVLQTSSSRHQGAHCMFWIKFCICEKVSTYTDTVPDTSPRVTLKFWSNTLKHKLCRVLLSWCMNQFTLIKVPVVLYYRCTVLYCTSKKKKNVYFLLFKDTTSCFCYGTINYVVQHFSSKPEQGWSSSHPSIHQFIRPSIPSIHSLS